MLHSVRSLTRVAVGVLSIALVAIGLMDLRTAPASASCAGPSIRLSPNRGPTGSSIVVEGRFFADACNDVIVDGERPPPAKGVKGIAITFEQGGKTTTRGTVDASDTDYTFSFTTTVPLTASTGAAVVRANEAEADFVVTAPSPAVPRRVQPKVTG